MCLWSGELLRLVIFGNGRVCKSKMKIPRVEVLSFIFLIKCRQEHISQSIGVAQENLV